jgi:hypothetical protein
VTGRLGQPVVAHCEHFQGRLFDGRPQQAVQPLGGEVAVAEIESLEIEQSSGQDVVGDECRVVGALQLASADIQRTRCDGAINVYLQIGMIEQDARKSSRRWASLWLQRRRTKLRRWEAFACTLIDRYQHFLPSFCRKFCGEQQ